MTEEMVRQLPAVAALLFLVMAFLKHLAAQRTAFLDHLEKSDERSHKGHLAAITAMKKALEG